MLDIEILEMNINRTLEKRNIHIIHTFFKFCKMGEYFDFDHKLNMQYVSNPQYKVQFITIN